MKNTLKLFGLIPIALGSSVACASTRSALEASYRNVGKAALTMQGTLYRKAFTSMSTNDFRMDDQYGRKLSTDRYLNLMDWQFKQLSAFPSSNFKITNLNQNGKSADVWVTSHVAMVMKPEPGSQKGYTSDIFYTTKDHWILVGKERKMQTMTVLCVEMRRDGKRVG